MSHTDHSLQTPVSPSRPSLCQAKVRHKWFWLAVVHETLLPIRIRKMWSEGASGTEVPVPSRASALEEASEDSFRNVKRAERGMAHIAKQVRVGAGLLALAGLLLFMTAFAHHAAVAIVFGVSKPQWIAALLMVTHLGSGMVIQHLSCLGV